MAESLGQATVDLIANTGGFEAGMDRAARKMQSVSKEAAYQGNQLEKLVGAIDPVTGALTRLDKQQEQLTAHWKAGRLPTEDYQKFTGILNAQKAATDATVTGFGKLDRQMAANGQTLKQYQNNLRGVPAQFTDIFTSLQGGQAPLTVLIQQGGQLKDMFGGVGAAGKALGGYVLGLVNPFTVAAAAAVALGVAYKQGSDESTAYNTALAATGNFAGTSADSLASMAQQVSKTTGTVGAAAEVLAQLAGSGKIAVGSFDEIAIAALKMQEATGKAATETVANFVKIAENPLAAIVKLNEGMNFLTETTYSQIKAFQDQGDAASAAAVANTAYADALNGVADKTTENLGYVESAWKIVKAAAKGAWDAMLNVGRDTTLDAAIEEAQKLVDTLAQAKATNGARGNGGGLAPDNSIRETDAQQHLTDLLLQREEKNRRESSARIAAQQKADALDAAQSIDKIHEGLATKDEQRDKARAAYLAQIDKLQAGVQRGTVQADDPRLNAERIAADLDGIDAKYQEKKSARAKAYVEDAGTKELDAAKQVYAVLLAQAVTIDGQGSATGKLGAAAQELIKWEQQIADIKSKGTLTAAQKSLLADEAAITAQKQQNANLEAQNTLREKAAASALKLLSLQQQLNDELQNVQSGYDQQMAGIGLGDEARKRLQDDLKIREDYQKKLAQLNRDYRKLEDPTAEETKAYDDQNAAIQSALDKRLEIQRQHYAAEDAAQSDWQNGALQAINTYLESANNVAAQSRTLVSNAMTGLEDSLVSAVETGKLSFKSLADSIIADLARIIARAYVVGPIIAALGIGGDSGTGATSGLGSLLGGSSGGGITGILSNIKNVVSVAGSSFGKSIITGFNSGDGIIGGIQNAFTNGADYLGSTISSAFSTGSASATAASNFAASSAAGASIEGYTGAAYSGYVSSANAASSLSALSTTLSYVGAVYSVIQSYQAYGAKGAATTAGFAAAGAAIGSVVPVIGTAIGAAIGAVVGSFVSSKAFGSGEKYADVSTSAQGTYSGGAYTTGGIVQGWQTKAPKYGANTDAALDATVAKFSSTLGNLYTAFGSATDVYAYDMLQVRKTSGKYSTTFGATIDGGGANDLNIHQQFDAADAAEALQHNYDDIMGTFLAKAIVSSKSLPDYFKAQFTEFANDWDTTADEVIKAIEGVFTRFNGVNDALSLINVANLKLDDTGLAASDTILNMVGSMADLDTATASAKDKVDALNDAVTTYYQAFFSADEQFADLTKSLQNAFAGFGLELPDTRAAYRGMVEDIDVTTAAGQAMFATLVGLAGNADSYYDNLEQKAASASQAAAEAAQAILDGLMSNATAAESAVERAINAQKASINDMLQTAQTNVSDLTSVSNDLSSALKALRGDSDSAVQMLRAQAVATLQNALATARSGGSLSGFDGLSDALDTVSNNSADMYASLDDFNRDQAQTANTLDELNKLNGKQLTSAEQTVKTLQSQLDRLDAQLAFAQAQLDALNGVDNSVKSVSDAILQMNLSVIAALAGIGGKGSTSTNNSTLIDTVYQSVLGRDADQAGKDYWLGQIASGAISLDQLAEAVKNAAKANGSLPAFARGTNSWDGGPALMGEFGPELVLPNGGATVYNAQSTARMLSASNTSDSSITSSVRDAKRENDDRWTKLLRYTQYLETGFINGFPTVAEGSQ